jgi:hypothetical protein
MKWIEEMGFLKLDLLKLDTLSIMHNVARMLGKDIDWLDSLMAERPGIYDASTRRPTSCCALAAPRASTACREARSAWLHRDSTETDDDLWPSRRFTGRQGRAQGSTRHSSTASMGARWESTNELVGGFLDETFGIAIFQEQIMEMGFGYGNVRCRDR